MVKYHTLQRLQCATVAQPVEQLTRNEQVVRSNRISSSKVKSPKSGFAPGFSGIFVWLGDSLWRGMWALIALISRKVFLKCKSRCKSKRARNKSAGLCTGLFEVSVQTVYFLLLEFFKQSHIHLVPFYCSGLLIWFLHRSHKIFCIFYDPKNSLPAAACCFHFTILPAFFHLYFWQIWCIDYSDKYSWLLT